MAAEIPLNGHHTSSEDPVRKLRRHIHEFPELSNQEVETTNTLIHFLQHKVNLRSKILPVTGGGFLAEYDFTKNDDQNYKTVIFRSELDAVPVEEKNSLEYKSANKGVSHKCGHDGHMAILCGLATQLSALSSSICGKVILLFQPAEELGTGALKMASTPEIHEILDSKDTYIFALHNVPGHPKGTIVLPRGKSFSSASIGMHIKLTGKVTHACQPHMGKNPALAMAYIIQGLLALPTMHIPYDQKALVTIVGAKAGDKAFGVSAGDAEVMATVRATTDSALTTMQLQAEKMVAAIASMSEFSTMISYEDEFAATINNPECADILRQSSVKCGFDIAWLDEAFPWSEDFGVFLQRAKGAMFGLGVGESHPPLHDAWYDFPDSEISTGVRMFSEIVSQILSIPN